MRAFCPLHGDYSYVATQHHRCPMIGCIARPEPLPTAEQQVLSKRQREVLILIAEGYGAKEIAYRLRISHKTVEFHREAICAAVGEKTTAKLVRHAIRIGLIDA